MKSIDYTEQDISDIINIFSSNGVRIEFKNKEQLIHTIKQVAKRTEKIALTSRFNDTRHIKLLEYDIEDMNIISTGIAYPIRFFDMCPQNQIKTHIDELLKLFDFYNGCILDFMGNIGLMYEGNSETKYEGSYVWMFHNIMYNVLPESWEDFLSVLNVPQNHLNFICIHKKDLILDYTGMNSKNVISKYAFVTKSSLFLERNPRDYYSNYHRINQVINCIEEQNAIEKIYGISMQISPVDSDFFALEYSIKEPDDDYDNFHYYIDCLEKHGLIDNDLSEKIKNYVFPDHNRMIIKYRWSNQNEFKIKLYVEEFLK
jgi:hypothetical protein